MFRTTFNQAVTSPPPPPAPDPTKIFQTSSAPKVDPTKTTSYILDECTREYQNLTIILIIGIFAVPVLLGVILIAYAIIQRPTLRRRVAELGIDPRAWASPMDAWILKVIGFAAMAVAAIVVLLTLLTFLIGLSDRGKNTGQPESQTDSRPVYPSSVDNNASVPADFGSHYSDSNATQQTIVAPTDPRVSTDGNATSAAPTGTDIDLAAAEKKDRAEQQASAKAAQDEQSANAMAPAIADSHYSNEDAGRHPGATARFPAAHRPTPPPRHVGGGSWGGLGGGH